MRLRLIVLALFAAASVSATAASLDVNLSSDSIEGRYNSSVGFGEMTLGALYNKDNKNWAANIGLLSTGEVDAGGRLEGGLGGKVYAVSVGDSEVLALGLGGQFRWFPNNGSFGLGGYAFYAPGIVTFLDGKRFWELGVRAEVELFKNSSLYVGYRLVRAELDDNTKRDVDKGGFVGIQIRF